MRGNFEFYGDIPGNAGAAEFRKGSLRKTRFDLFRGGEAAEFAGKVEDEVRLLALLVRMTLSSEES